jgi:hypothetical protein
MSRSDQKHHYIPVFYLKRWANTDCRLCEFSRPHKLVRPRRTHPDGTGYFRGLYTLDGLASGRENILETAFLKSIDDAASQALAGMIEGQDFTEPLEMKTAWSRFMMSLLVRHPEALKEMKQRLQVNVQDAYRQTRKPNEPERFEDNQEKSRSKELGRLHGSLLVDLVQDSKLARSWNKMVWSIVRFANLDNELLTSDRPIVMNAFQIADAHVCLSVSTSKMFFASVRKDGHERLKAIPPALVAETMNDAVTKQAVKFVYARTDRQLRFVENRLGRFTRPIVDF